MMTKPLLAILLLVPLSASAGDLDGKALLCLEAVDDASLSGFYFQRGKVFHSMLHRTGEGVLQDVFVYEVGQSYETKVDTVEWRNSPDSLTVLNRKTLDIEFRWHNNAQSWKCDLAESMGAYHSALEAERVTVNKQITDRMKDNQI